LHRGFAYQSLDTLKIKVEEPIAAGHNVLFGQPKLLTGSFHRVYCRGDRLQVHRIAIANEGYPPQGESYIGLDIGGDIQVNNNLSRLQVSRVTGRSQPAQCGHAEQGNQPSHSAVPGVALGGVGRMEHLSPLLV
jgi:hypothetical protein